MTPHHILNTHGGSFLTFLSYHSFFQVWWWKGLSSNPSSIPHYLARWKSKGVDICASCIFELFDSLTFHLKFLFTDVSHHNIFSRVKSSCVFVHVYALWPIWECYQLSFPIAMLLYPNGIKKGVSTQKLDGHAKSMALDSKVGKYINMSSKAVLACVPFFCMCFNWVVWQ